MGYRPGEMVDPKYPLKKILAFPQSGPQCVEDGCWIRCSHDAREQAVSARRCITIRFESI